MKLGVGNVTNNVTNTRLNKSSLFLVEGTSVVDEPGNTLSDEEVLECTLEVEVVESSLNLIISQTVRSSASRLQTRRPLMYYIRNLLVTSSH